MAHDSEIRFILNGADVRLSDVDATQTLLDFLRLNRRLTGTKEGCAEGDCGACTVLVGRLGPDGLVYEPVNACIRFLASVNGCHVVTIEHVRGTDGALHPVQQALVDHHASQCGFCTPGIVMSLYALWMQSPEPTKGQVETALQGNLCRCTGYEPIIKAAMAASRYGSPLADALTLEREAITARLEAIRQRQRIVMGAQDRLTILPVDVDDFADCLMTYPTATIIAGATDVGLWVTKFLKDISPAIFIGHLNDLKSTQLNGSTLKIGAGASYTDCQSLLMQHFAHLGPYWDRIAGWQVRNMGTLGGNIANGSPIGDMPPVLIALGAQITLRRGPDRRVLPLEAYFIDYGLQDREAGEFVESIEIPLPKPNEINAAYKLSKRRDEDISSVAVGLRVTVTDGIIEAARIVYGGMAATPKRAKRVEAALIGQAWTPSSFERAANLLTKDFAPLSDWRASAEYRMLTAQNLLRRFFLEHDAQFKAPVQIAQA